MELLLTVCLLAVPTDCRDEHIPSLEPLAPMACLTGAQPMIAEWSASHPKWKITRWRCGPVGAAGQEL